MKARNVTTEEMYQALDKVNEKYAGNVDFKGMEGRGSYINFTLRVQSSKGPGHRRGFGNPFEGTPGKRLISACWHVHGDYFEALLEIQPETVITSNMARIDKNGGNWQDRNIGSQMHPMYYSEACDCGKE